MEVYRIPLKRTKQTKKYSPHERVQIHLNNAKVKYARRLGPKTLKAAVGNEPVTDFANDVGYYGPITLGGQDFQVQFDTGSSDLWVAQVNYNKGEANSHNTFDPSKSKTFKTNNKTFSITYGQGFASGIAATETLTISQFTIDGQAFGLANKVSSDFETGPFDGIIGMAFEQLSQLKSPTPFQNLVSDQDVSSSVFSFIFGREKDNTSSELLLGGLDPNFSSNISNNKVVNPAGFWQIGFDGTQVNGKSVDISSSQAIIDTGTTLVIVPTADADAIHNAIPGAKLGSENNGTYLVPSDTNAVVSLTFGGVTYNIKSEDLIFDDAGNGQSISGIQGGGIPGMETTWLVGDVFLKNVFSAFDINKKTVGFAPNPPTDE